RRVFRAVTGKLLTRDEVLQEVTDAGHNPMSAARFLARVMGYLNDYGKEQILRAATLVSRCDGELHAREAELVRRLGGVLRLPARRVERILGMAEGAWADTSSSERSL
ncbi:MAG TPA: TerB family tellurite resistance protein, partial [Longimicrobiales bacterium]